MTISKRVKANLGLVLVALIWSTDGLADKIMLRYGGVLGLIFWAHLIAGLFILGISLKELKKIDRKTTVSYIALGLLIFLHCIFVLNGLKDTTLSKYGFYVQLEVLFIPLLAVMGITKTKLDSKYLLYSLLSVFGIFLISYGQDYHFTFNRGDLYTTIGIFFYSLYVVLTKRFVSSKEVGALVGIQDLTVAACTFIFALCTKSDVIVQPNLYAVILLLYQGIVLAALTYILQAKCLKYTSEFHLAIICAAIPFINLILAYIFEHEKMSMLNIIGGVVLTVTLVFLQFKSIKTLRIHGVNKLRDHRHMRYHKKKHDVANHFTDHLQAEELKV